jgi:hypothetical protein
MPDAKPLAGGFFCPVVLGVSTVPINEDGDLVLDDVPDEQKAAVLESFYQTYPVKRPPGKATAKPAKP